MNLKQKYNELLKILEHVGFHKTNIKVTLKRWLGWFWFNMNLCFPVISLFKFPEYGKTMFIFTDEIQRIRSIFVHM